MKSYHLSERKQMTIGAFRDGLITGMDQLVLSLPYELWFFIIQNKMFYSRIQFQVGKGLINSMMGDNKARADIIPVDFVSNMLICTAYHIAIEK